IPMSTAEGHAERLAGNELALQAAATAATAWQDGGINEGKFPAAEAREAFGGYVRRAKGTTGAAWVDVFPEAVRYLTHRGGGRRVVLARGELLQHTRVRGRAPRLGAGVACHRAPARQRRDLMANPQHSDSIVVARSPEDLYDMVSDVTQMGSWSPVCKACWWD